MLSTTPSRRLISLSVAVPPLMIVLLSSIFAWDLHRLTTTIGPEDRPELVAIAASAGPSLFAALGLAIGAAAIVWLPLRALRSALEQARSDLDAQSDRQERERLSRVFEELHHHAIFMLDTEGRVASWDRDAERLMGYRLDDVMARHVLCLYDQTLNRRDTVMNDMVEATSHGRWEATRWVRRKDGFRFEANVSLVAIRNSEGALCGFTQVIHEILEEQAA